MLLISTPLLEQDTIRWFNQGLDLIHEKLESITYYEFSIQILCSIYLLNSDIKDPQIWTIFVFCRSKKIALGKGTFYNNVGKEDRPFTRAFSC